MSTIVDQLALEELAESEHASWAHWMAYQFSKCLTFEGHEGAAIIPAALADRWRRQVDTPYSELSEAEKQSDRDVASKYRVPLIELALVRWLGRDATWEYDWAAAAEQSGRAHQQRQQEALAAVGFADHQFVSDQDNWPCDHEDDGKPCGKPIGQHALVMQPWHELSPGHRAALIEQGREGFKLGHQYGSRRSAAGEARELLGSAQAALTFILERLEDQDISDKVYECRGDDTGCFREGDTGAWIDSDRCPALWLGSLEALLDRIKEYRTPVAS